MDTVAYTSILPEILPHATGVPRIIAENEIRNTVIDCCKEAGIWQHVFDPIDSIVGQSDYNIPVMNVGDHAEMHRPVWVLYKGERLHPITHLGAEKEYPNHRQAALGKQPKVFVQRSREVVSIIPLPTEWEYNEAGEATNILPDAITIRAELKPTRRSTTTDQEVLEEYHELVVAGTLARLLRQPNQTWTNGRASDSYAATYAIQMGKAKQKAMASNQGILRTVRYGGLGADADRALKDPYQLTYHR